jgi:hypothetical protein
MPNISTSVRSSGSRAGADVPALGDSPIAGHSAVTEVAVEVESLVELNAAGWDGSPPLCAQAVTTATAASATRKEVGLGMVVVLTLWIWLSAVSILDSDQLAGAVAESVTVVHRVAEVEAEPDSSHECITLEGLADSGRR